MPFELTQANGLLSVRVSGRVTVAELEEYGRSLEAAEGDAASTLNRLVDLSNMDHVDIAFDGIANFGRHRQEARLKVPIKTAIFAPQTLQFGFARMFQIWCENPKNKIEVFRTLAEAREWLDKPAAHPKAVSVHVI